MIVITCLDQKNGMMFNHRRQSQDCVLREHVAELVDSVPFWMNHYSASQFDTESIPNLNIDDAFLQEAAQGEYCLLKKLAVRMIGRNNSTSSRNVTESADCDMMRLLLQAARPI